MSFYYNDEEQKEQVDALVQEYYELDEQQRINISKSRKSLKAWIIYTLESIFKTFNYFDDIIDEIQSIIERSIDLDE